ncbi:DUF3631 domain-containing protein [Lysobacter sp. HA35]
MRLAKLTPLEYDSQRSASAKLLKVRPATLDKVVAAERAKGAPPAGGGRRLPFNDVDPWPFRVNAADVLDEMLATMRRYVVADACTLRAAVLWCAMTWFVAHATVLPIALITAPERECGKTTLLDVMGRFAFRALLAANISSAALFRCVEAWSPTLMIDEADAFLRESEELRGIVNSGHTLQSAKVVRTVEVNGNHEPRVFPTFCPRAIATIGRQHGTIESRSIVLGLRRALPGEVAERLRHADPAVFVDVQRKLARWARDDGLAFAKARPTLQGLSNRDADNVEPLLALADLAGGDWPRLARDALLAITGNVRATPSVNEELLADVRAVFAANGVDRLSSEGLVEALTADVEGRWATLNNGRPITPRQLSQRLQTFKVAPKTVRIGERTLRGYLAVQFADAFRRYLRPSGGAEGATPQQALSGEAFGDSARATHAATVADERVREPLQYKGCGGVADSDPSWEAIE